jgi:curved DNA-binding protein
LARKFHPDVSKEADAEAQFKKVGEAYAVLKDPDKRAAYDQLGENWKAGQDFSAPPGWDAGFEFRGARDNVGDGFDSSDFFSALFGHGFHEGATGGQTGRSQDHHAKVTIDLEDAWRGGQRKFSLRVPVVGSSGHLELKERSIEVKIPKGVRQGQHIRLSGLGEPSAGNTQAGDLYLEIDFAPHPLYQPEGHDLHIDLPVAPWEAALGEKVKLPTPSGVVELTVPAGSSSGKKLRLKGRGIPGPEPGDLYATLRIALPKADTESAKSAYEAMRRDLDFDPRAHMTV